MIFGAINLHFGPESQEKRRMEFKMPDGSLQISDIAEYALLLDLKTKHIHDTVSRSSLTERLRGSSRQA